MSAYFLLYFCSLMFPLYSWKSPWTKDLVLQSNTSTQNSTNSISVFQCLSDHVISHRVVRARALRQSNVTFSLTQRCHMISFCRCRKRLRSCYSIERGETFIKSILKIKLNENLSFSYIKKLIEDTNIGDDGLKLLQYCSWENPQFSQALLTELLWHCGFAYWHDMRHHTELLLHILLMEDSWQHHRIHNALMGKLGWKLVC